MIGFITYLVLSIASVLILAEKVQSLRARLFFAENHADRLKRQCLDKDQQIASLVEENRMRHITDVIGSPL